MAMDTIGYDNAAVRLAAVKTWINDNSLKL
jgi:hypothetical protein